jgi:transposase
MCQAGDVYSQQKVEKESDIEITRVGVDIAKNVFQVHRADRRGRPVWKRQLRRAKLPRVLTEKLDPGCEIGMEECSGAHHWARQLRSRGFEVKLIPPQYVEPYVKSQKNDVTDAEDDGKRPITLMQIRYSRDA